MNDQPQRPAAAAAGGEFHNLFPLQPGDQTAAASQPQDDERIQRDLLSAAASDGTGVTGCIDRHDV